MNVRIFVASPGELLQERNQLDSVVAELGRTMGRDLGFGIELLRWERDSVPGMGRPQAVINQNIGSYHFFVGMLWKRFGVPTGVAESGTEEEFRLAYRRWQNKEIHDILFYFCEAPWVFRQVAELDQARAVLRFREELERLALVSTYRDRDRFADTVRPHLYNKFAGFRNFSESPRSMPEPSMEPLLQLELEGERERCALNNAPFRTTNALRVLLRLPESAALKVFDQCRGGFGKKLLQSISDEVETHSWLQNPIVGFQPFRWGERPEIATAEILANREGCAMILLKHLLLAILEGNSRTQQELKDLLGHEFESAVKHARSLPAEPIRMPYKTGPVFKL